MLYLYQLGNNAYKTGTDMRLTACGCSAAYFQREQRKWWMKTLSTRRLYRCLACDATLFLSAERVNQLLGPGAQLPEDSLPLAARSPGNQAAGRERL